MKNLLTFLFAFLFLYSLQAQSDLNYQLPPDGIKKLVDAPPTPQVSISPGGEYMLLMQRPGLPSLKEMMQPELRIAGLRINPKNNGPSRTRPYASLAIKELSSAKTVAISGWPENEPINNVRWSPDGKHVAFTVTRNSGMELFVADSESGKARSISGATINGAVRGTPYIWMPDNQHILYKSVDPNRGEMSDEKTIPTGPVISETTGRKAAARTYQDLLKSKSDEAQFQFYATSTLYKVHINGEAKEFGSPQIYTGMSASPDGQYVLLSYRKKPFSYLVPYYRFPEEVEVWSSSGEKIKTIQSTPLIEEMPKGFGAVRLGPRNHGWRADQAATLYWVEALDGGDPKSKVEFRDKLFFLNAPFNGDKIASIPFTHRYGSITWGDDGLAIAYESWWKSRTSIVSSFSPQNANSKKKLFEYSYEDRYSHPGQFLTTRNKMGRNVLLKNKQGQLILSGQGSSAKGDRPFIRNYDLASGKTQEIWRSKAPHFEYPVDVLNINKGIFITRRESKNEPPNYFLTETKKDKSTAITEFQHPYPSLVGIEKQVVRFKRADGVDLQGNLYLPKGYKKEDGPLPVMMWAYPREMKSAKAAGQVKGSPHQFVRLSWGGAIPWVTQGYAVFDDVSMPVIGEGDAEPNDSFRKQLVDNAAAAIDKLVEIGIADRDRVAVGGHSYGAFMTANLLAHSDLFAAGIARSGAYNRTLTPFGFQREERTYWEAPEIYYNMSPFMHADKVNEPILLIHGQADNNSGTFPMQSERFFNAIKGLGGTARLVMLPYESHGYRSRESVMHMMWEMDQWMDEHVKNGEKKKTRP